MGGIWQDVAVTAIAGVALAWLIRQRIRARKKGCATCSLAEAVAQATPVQTDAKPARETPVR